MVPHLIYTLTIPLILVFIREFWWFALAITPSILHGYVHLYWHLYIGYKEHEDKLEKIHFIAYYTEFISTGFLLVITAMHFYGIL